jgi:hypothetical protein
MILVSVFFLDGGTSKEAWLSKVWEKGQETSALYTYDAMKHAQPSVASARPFI